MIRRSDNVFLYGAENGKVVHTEKWDLAFYESVLSGIASFEFRKCKIADEDFS